MARATWRYNEINIIEAPFIWINRISHPLLTSFIMWITELNAIWDEGLKCIDIRTPVSNWIKIIIPKIDPIFHQLDMLIGEGRSIKFLLTMDIMILDFRFGDFISKWA